MNGCITNFTGRAVFRQIEGYAEMLSGLVDSYDPKHVQRIQDEIENKGGSYKDVEVDCHRLIDLLETHQIPKIDFLSIDVEGAEVEILKSIDFEKTEISVIAVENNYRTAWIPFFLIRKGYRFHSILGDEFYIKK